MSNRDNPSVDDLGEWGLISELAARMPSGPGVSIGIGDDSAVIAAPGGQVVAAVDMLLEGRHFLMKWSSATDVGTKAAARSLADIAAMGASSTALLVSLAAPGSLSASWALSLASALAAEAAEIELPPGRGHAYLFGEAMVVSRLREILAGRGLGQDQMSPKAYWGRGRANAGHGEPARDA